MTGTSARILVADDKASSRELIRTVLEHSGYEVFEASDGVEALEMARSCDPELILLDLQMPRMDGFAVVQEMRRDDQLKRLPIAALTASAMQSDREKVLQAGFSAYITKPVTLSILREEIARLLLEARS